MLLALTMSALAADWLALQGTEAGPDPAALRPWGFVQALGEGIVGGEPVEGLTSEALAPYNGQLATFNQVGSGTWGASIRRARLGVRGRIPKTRVDYLAAFELGDNGLTRVDPVVLTDASVTFSYVPGARLRFGQFKLPIGEEALEMNPLAAEFVNFTNTTAQLLNENPVTNGAYAGPASGFRDVGVQLFDRFDLGPGALAYAVMVSNGRPGTLELDEAKDVSARFHYAPVVWGDDEGPHREEIAVFGFWQQGERTLDGVTAPRIRRGGGAEVRRAGWRARAEVVQASGAIEAGTNPPFPGSPVVVTPVGEALGAYAFVHYEHPVGPVVLGGGARYDELHRRTDSPADLRVFRTATLNAQVEFSPRARLLVDYELRWLSAPEASPDAQTIAATLGDRVSLQAVAVF